MKKERIVLKGKSLEARDEFLEFYRNTKHDKFYSKLAEREIARLLKDPIATWWVARYMIHEGEWAWGLEEFLKATLPKEAKEELLYGSHNKRRIFRLIKLTDDELLELMQVEQNRYELTARNELPKWARKWLYETGDSSVKSNLARRQDLDEEEIRKMAEGSEAEKWMIASRKDLPVGVLTKLAEDPSETVSGEACSNEALDKVLMKKIVQKGTISQKLGLAKNPKVSPKFLIELMRKEGGVVINKVMYRREIHPAVLEEILKSKNPNVRKAATSSSWIFGDGQEEARRRLLLDEDVTVVVSALERFRVDVPTGRKLLRRPEREIKLTMARRVSSEELLEELACELSVSIRREILANRYGSTIKARKRAYVRGGLDGAARWHQQSASATWFRFGTVSSDDWRRAKEESEILLEAKKKAILKVVPDNVKDFVKGLSLNKEFGEQLGENPRGVDGTRFWGWKGVDEDAYWVEGFYGEERGRAALPENGGEWGRIVRGEIWGAIGGGDGKARWWSVALEQGKRPTMPQVRARWRNGETITRQANLLGVAIFEGGKYALWESDRKKRGWTIEEGEVPPEKVVTEKEWRDGRNTRMVERLLDLEKAMREGISRQMEVI